MALEFEQSDLEDPFANASVLSLLPRSRRTISDADSAAGSETQDLAPVRTLFKSMMNTGSKEILEQAQAIHKDISKFLSLYLKDGDKAIAESCKDQKAVTENGKNLPQERRPALGRKRARFSLKPISSNTVPTVNLNSSIDHIEDPEEYFLAFEKLQNADKELKKLRGKYSTDLGHNHQPTAARKRRPGILGKTASYKHHFTAENDTGEGLVISQDDLTYSSQSKSSPATVSDNVLQPRESQLGPLEETEKKTSQPNDADKREGSVVEKEKNVGRLLDELFSSFKDLGGDDEVAFLREKLQINSIDVGKLHLPEVTSFRRQDLVVENKIALRRKAEISQLAKASPILLSSPLAAISMLQRRIPLRSPARDPYPMHPTDDIQGTGKFSPSSGLGQYCDSPIDVKNNDSSGSSVDIASTPVRVSGKRLKYMGDCRTENIQNTGKFSPCSGQGPKSASPIYMNNNDISSSIAVITSTPVRISGSRQTSDPKLQSSPNDIVQDSEESPPVAVVASTPVRVSNRSQELQSPTPSGDLHHQTNVASKEPLLEDPVLSLDGKNYCTNSKFDMEKDAPVGLDGCFEVDRNNVQMGSLMTEQREPGQDDLTYEHLNHNDAGNLASESGTNYRRNANALPVRLERTSEAETDGMIEGDSGSKTAGLEENPSAAQEAVLPVVEHLEDSSIIANENTEGRQDEVGASIVNRRAKRKAPAGKQKKPTHTSSRFSLAGAGTAWDTGLRRSTRIRSRPLQYWCGERFLYGRIHDSLATVIGVKYASPSNPGMKVKSFVSEEYSDLVEQVALH